MNTKDFLIMLFSTANNVCVIQCAPYLLFVYCLKALIIIFQTFTQETFF